MAYKLRSIKDQKKVDWKGAFKALQYLPRFFSEIFKSAPKAFIFNLLGRLFNAFTPIATLFIGKLLIDEIIIQINTDTSEYDLIWTYLSLELAIVLFSELANRLINLTDGLVGDLYSNYTSVLIIEKTKDLTISQLEDSNIYDKLERARTQTSGRVSLMSNTLFQLQSFIVVVSLIAGLIYFEPWLIILLIFNIIPSFLNEMKFSSERYSIARSWTAERRELDYLRYIGANDNTAKEMKLFGLIDFVAQRFKRLSDAYFEINKGLAIRRTLLGFLFNLLGTLSYYGAYVLIIIRTVAGILTVGDLTFLSGSFSRLRNNLQNIFSRLTRIAESALYLKDYFEFIDIPPPKSESENATIPQKIVTGFEFRNVSFKYPGTDQYVLENISFKISAGEKIAFVGQNGAGKTTLIKLLLRFYPLDNGTILLDDIDIERFPKEEYRKLFGVIFQDFIRYEFLLKENIAVGNIELIEDTEAINEAAERSLADEVISDLEHGLDQQLGRRFSRGVNLSGGQWQKVALARAYMKDAPCMILDEPTSALDARAEYEAFQRFIGLTKGKTSIIISHRFSTVRMADRIIVLKDGRILESGSHEELMSNNGLYEELFSLQAAGYN